MQRSILGPPLLNLGPGAAWRRWANELEQLGKEDWTAVIILQRSEIGGCGV